MAGFAAGNVPPTNAIIPHLPCSSNSAAGRVRFTFLAKNVVQALVLFTPRHTYLDICNAPVFGASVAFHKINGYNQY
jgi:hypothetical protein